MKNLQKKSSTRVYHKSQIRQPHPTDAPVIKSGSAASSNGIKKVTMQDVCQGFAIMFKLFKPFRAWQRNSSTQAYHKSQSRQHPTYAPVTKSGSTSASSNGSKKVSMQHICHVQNLIERCLQLYMEKDEIVKTLLSQAKIESEFTAEVWQRLEEENADFFKAYYIGLKLKKQILLFNQMIEHQYHLMKCSFPITVSEPLAAGHNGIHSMPVNNLPMRYPVLKKASIPAAYQPHLDSMGGGISSCHVVSGIAAPSNFHPIQTNSGNSMVMDRSAHYMVPVIPSNGAMSSLLEMTVNPTSVTSSGYFPFTESEIPGMDAHAWALDMADLPDLGDMVDNPGSLFMQFDSNIFLGSSVQKGIGNGDDFFVNSKPVGSQTGEIASEGMASQIGFSPV